MNRLLLLVSFCFLFLSCSNRPKDVLKAKELTDILVELHTLDGIFATDGYHNLPVAEKNKYYKSVLRKYHINQAQFDSTLVWYSRDPKKLEKIYVRVINRLTEEETAVKAGKYYPIVPQPVVLSSAELWKDSTHHVFKGDSSARKQLAFVVVDSTLMMQDLYVLRFRHRIEPEDSCANPHVLLNVHYAGGKVDSLYSPMQHEGESHHYTLCLHADRESKIDSLSGRIWAGDSCAFAHDAYVDSISLIRKYNADIQDELRMKTERNETYRTFEYRLFPMPDDKYVLFKKGKMEKDEKQKTISLYCFSRSYSEHEDTKSE